MTQNLPQPSAQIISHRLNQLSELFSLGKVTAWSGPHEHKNNFAKFNFDTEKEQGLRYVYDTENLSNF